MQERVDLGGVILLGLVQHNYWRIRIPEHSEASTILQIKLLLEDVDPCTLKDGPPVAEGVTPLPRQLSFSANTQPLPLALSRTVRIGSQAYHRELSTPRSGMCIH